MYSRNNSTTYTNEDNKMAIQKKPCINDASYTYTGKESSPLGLGYSASAENVTVTMKGKDGTMWRVAMKNGVKVWTRVPADAAQDTLQHEEPVMTEEKKEEPKKKVTRKKKVEEPKPEPESEPEVVQETVAEPEPVEAPVEKPKKKVVRKKKSDDEASTSSEKKEKKPRKPTDFNLFMKYRMRHMGEMNHKEKFSKAASEWKNMAQEDKVAVMVKVKEELGME